MSESIKTISSGSKSWHHTKTLDEELELFEKYPAGDPELIRILKEYYHGFIVLLAKQYLFRGLDISKLIELAENGFEEGAKKYDHTKGIFFQSYIVWWMRKSILQELEGPAKVIPVPPTESEIDSFFEAIADSESQQQIEINESIERVLSSLSEREREVICQRYGILCRKMSTEEIGESLGITQTRVNQIIGKVLNRLNNLKEQHSSNNNS